MRKTIEVNDDNVLSFEFYDKNIRDIKSNELFGIIVSKFYMNTITPNIDIVNGNIAYNFSVDYEFVSEDIDYPNDIDAISGGEDLPLIMRKLKDNLAQEILSGEKFMLCGSFESIRRNVYNKTGDISEYQNKEEIFKNDNIVLNCTSELSAYDEQGNKTQKNSYIVLDDTFKEFYYDNTLSNKEDVIMALKYIKLKAKEQYYKEYKKCISRIQSVAYTENLLYDLKQKKI